MSTKTSLVLGVLIIIIIIAGVVAVSLRVSNNSNQVKPDDKSDLIQVANIKPGQTVKSPLTITGQARGYWYFEASFPVKVLDANGNELGITPSRALGEWMTESFVPFEVTINFATSTTATGTLVFMKDNPSGLPENNNELRMPIKFSDLEKQTEVTTKTNRMVKLYFYNPEKDKDQNDNIMCSRQGLVSVTRQIPITKTPIQDTVKLLLQGNPTSAEKSQGVTTEFPLSGVSLTSTSNNNGVLTLTFSDPNNRTGGGSCRVAILWAQIEATAKQFDGITSVRFSPDTLFQP